MGERELVEIGSYEKIPLLFSEVQTIYMQRDNSAKSVFTPTEMSSSIPRCFDQGFRQLKGAD